jgi:hypothetical protein
VALISGKVAKYRITYVGPDGAVLPVDKYRELFSDKPLDAQYPNAAIEWL